MYGAYAYDVSGFGYYVGFALLGLLSNEEYYAKAQAVVSLASDVDTGVFTQIALGSGRMNGALKEFKRRLAEAGITP